MEQQCIQVRIGCDAHKLRMALERIVADMETWERAPTPEEIRAHLEGMPPITLTVDGKVVDQVFLAL